MLLLSRYERVKTSKTPEEQDAILYACGYATDSSYAGKLVALMSANDLTKYDVVKEDDKLNLTQYQCTALEDCIKKLLAEKIISDTSWLDKSKQKKLTISELTWMNTMALSRK